MTWKKTHYLVWGCQHGGAAPGSVENPKRVKKGPGLHSRKGKHNGEKKKKKKTGGEGKSKFCRAVLGRKSSWKKKGQNSEEK